MIRCATCNQPKAHFTAIDDGGLGFYCDECVIAGNLSCIGITMPDVPGVNQLSRESTVPADLAKLSPGPHFA